MRHKRGQNLTERMSRTIKSGLTVLAGTLFLNGAPGVLLKRKGALAYSPFPQ